ncbi:MAG: hypothetical protein OXC47_05850, partial [Cyanobacteria bacterium MAG APA_bin_95]|nr:hypothetical protein [Cyanobacteria bacterium MAG APA_bin_95]
MSVTSPGESVDPSPHCSATNPFPTNPRHSPMKTGRYGTPDWRQLATGGLRKLGCLSTALLATLWHPASSVQAQTFRSVIVFGDSLSDSGNTADLQTLQAPPHLHYP